MKQLFFFLLTLILSVSNVFSQATLQWGHQIGGIKTDYATAFTLDSSNNVYTTGRFMGDVDFDPSSTGTSILQSTGYGKMFVSKMDENGNLLWAKSIGESVPRDIGPGGPFMSSTNRIEAYSIKTDKTGNVYITGIYRDSTIDFDPGSGVKTLSSGSVFILKLDTDGNFGWVYKIGEKNISVEPASLVVDQTNGIYLLGSYKNSKKGTSVEIDFDQSDETHTITSTKNNNLVTNNGMYLLKVTKDGDFSWVKSIEHFFPQGVYGPTYFLSMNASCPTEPMAIDKDGNIFIGGTVTQEKVLFSGWVDTIYTVDFDPSTESHLVFNNDNKIYTYIVKLGSDGAFKWVTKSVNVEYGGDSNTEGGINSIAIDKDGAVFYTGIFSDAYYRPQSFIGKLSVNGITLWTKYINGFLARTILPRKEGDFYLSGTFIAPGYKYDSIQDMNVKENADMDLGEGTFYYPNGTDTVTITDPISGTQGPIGSNVHTLSRMDRDGNLKWFEAFGSADQACLLDIELSTSGCDLFLAGGTGFASSANLLYQSDPPPAPSGIYYTTGVNKDYDPGKGELKFPNRQYGEIYITKFTDNLLPKPLITPSDSMQLCAGDSIELHADGVYPNYLWSPSGATTQFIEVKTEGKYALTISDACGAQTSDSVVISMITKPILNIIGDSSLCGGGTAELIVSGADSYSWSPITGLDNPTNDTVSITTSSTITYVVTGTIGGSCTSSKHIKVAVGNAVSADAGVNDTICSGESSVLTGNGGLTYLWDSGQTSKTITVSPSLTTDYIFTAIDGDCKNFDTVKVVVNELPIVGITPDTIISEGGIVDLKATGGGSYQWSPSIGLSCSDCATPSVSPESATNYCVTVTSTNGCQTKKCMNIKIDIDCGELFVPNAFSPNGDNINDNLEVKVKLKCVENYSLQIFDRWGEKVFETTKVTDSWDGKYDGKELDNAVFVYFAKVKLINSSEPIVKKGNVSIIK